VEGRIPAWWSSPNRFWPRRIFSLNYVSEAVLEGLLCRGIVSKQALACLCVHAAKFLPWPHDSDHRDEWIGRMATLFSNLNPHFELRMKTDEWAQHPTHFIPLLLPFAKHRNTANSLLIDILPWLDRFLFSTPERFYFLCIVCINASQCKPVDNVVHLQLTRYNCDLFGQMGDLIRPLDAASYKAAEYLIPKKGIHLYSSDVERWKRAKLQFERFRYQKQYLLEGIWHIKKSLPPLQDWSFLY